MALTLHRASFTILVLCRVELAVHSCPPAD